MYPAFMAGQTINELNDQPTKIENRHQTRPSSVTLLAYGVLSFAGINLLRLYQTVIQWEFLAELLPFPPLYLAVSGLVWGAVGLLAVWGLWRGACWAPGFTQLLALAYLIFYWLDRLLLATQHTNWLFAIAGSVFGLVLVFWILSRRKAIDFFGR